MTKVLVISDVHANKVALEAVLADAGVVDDVWCLGDVVGYGPQPNECVERLRGLSKLTCMMGNHDFAAAGDDGMEVFNTDARKALLWHREILTEENKMFLRNLETTLTVRGDASLVHGSPRDPIWEYIMNTLVARINMSFYDTPVCFMGHSHFQAVFQYDEKKDNLTIEVPRPAEQYPLKDRAMINPGSVGQPRDRDPRAAYGVLHVEDNIWEPRRVEYDIKTVQKQILEAGLPPRHAERLSGGW